MVTKKKKETTVEDLALMIAKGFEQVDKRFEQVDKRFEQIDKRFEQVDKHFDRMDARMANMEETNTTEHAEMRPRLNNMAYRFELTELGRRVTILEKKIK